MSGNRETRENALERIAKSLSDKEVYAYSSWCESKQAPIGATLNAQLFALFLNGKSCDEIRRLNPALSLGQVVEARVSGDWDRRRDEHLDQLLTATSDRVRQTTLETATLLCDVLAAAAKEHGDAAARYLQTGNPKDLGGLRIEGFGQLKAAIEALQRLTGQSQQQTVTVKGEVVHRTETDKEKTMTSADAMAMLKELTDGKD